MFCTVFALGQDYSGYHHRINVINESILSKNIEKALIEFDSLSSEYPFIHARHVFKAFQCAIHENDIGRTKYWMERSFASGIPLWYHYLNEITGTYLRSLDSVEVAHLYREQHGKYQSSINAELRKQVDSLLKIDQQHTDHVNDGFLLARGTIYNAQWKKNNEQQAMVIQKMIAQYGYPGERLIGIDPAPEDSIHREYYAFNGPRFKERSVTIMLLHYFSNPRPEFNEQLLRELKVGNMEPEEFGQINDFIARHGRGKYAPKQYYHVWFKDTSLSNMMEVENRRRKVGLPDLKLQEEIRKTLIDQYKAKSRNASLSLH